MLPSLSIPCPLSVNALRHCHLSRGERQECSNVGVGCIRRGDEGHRPLHAHSLREDECRGRPLDVPRHKQNAVCIRKGLPDVPRKKRRHHDSPTPRRCAAPSTGCPPSLGKGGKGDGVLGCGQCLPLYSTPRLAFGKGRYARPPAGGCPSMPCGIATSPAGRGENAPCGCWLCKAGR